MRWGIPIPQFVSDGEFEPAGFRRYLARAEQLGFSDAWTQEQILGTMPHLAALETMAYAAACTDRLRLGCAVFVSPLHVPAHLAKGIGSLDQLSRGRLEVGLGVGGPRAFGAFGIDGDGLISRFTEGVELMKALWTSERVSHDGRFWQLTDASMEPKPFQKPYPPLWFGANAPAALRRAVRHADGFFGAGSTTTERFTEQVRTVRSELVAQGRDGAGFRIAKRVYLAVDDDVERGRQRIAAALGRLYGDFRIPDLMRVAVVGTAADCVRGLREVAAAGAELIALNPLFDEAEQMERLAAEVVPEVSTGIPHDR